MKPTLEQIQDSIRVNQYFNSDGKGHLDVELYALTLAEQVAKGEVVVVPKEPTKAMRFAGAKNIDHLDCFYIAKDTYKAMINAAQPPQEASDERD